MSSTLGRNTLAPACAGLVVLLLGGGLPAGAAQDRASPVGARYAIANGVLTDHGTALAGADVVALAWPPQEALQRLKEGDPVTKYVLGRTKSDRAGRFAIDADPTSVPATFRGNGNQVDVELVFGDGTREARWNYSVVPSTGPGAWSLRGKGHTDFRADLGDGIGYDRADDPAQWVGTDGKVLGAGKARGKASLVVSAAGREFDQLRTQRIDALRAELARPAAVPSEVCVTSASTMHYGLPEYFMQAYAWSGATATVVQQYGTVHTLGVGYSATGSNASFKQSGSISTSMSASASRSGVADAYVWNKVNYRDYVSSCSLSKTRKPYSVNALLSNFTYSAHPSWSTCQTYTGGTYTKSQGTNVTYGAGVDIGPINVSAQSGWSSNTEITWTVTSRTKICGNSSAGWVTSSIAESSRG